YAWSIFIRTIKGRGHRAHRAFISVYLLLFEDLEVVSRYTAEAFLAAFRHFISCQGICEEVYSDDREFFRESLSDSHRITHAAATEEIKWHFNPLSASHFGGFYEAAVKSAKYHLRRVISETKLTFKEMSTRFLAQVEACLNFRSLHALSDDPDDVSTLMPEHFLIGVPLLAIPEPLITDKTENTLSRWQHL
ncbi:hypothetical protein X777_15523, partial [Ooceraea biroi]